MFIFSVCLTQPTGQIPIPMQDAVELNSMASMQILPRSATFSLFLFSSFFFFLLLILEENT